MASARWVRAATATVLAACLLGTVGLDSARAGDEDFDFGQGLLKRRWYDLAEGVFRDLSKSGSTQEMRNRGELGLINVLKTRAENEPNPDEKKKLFDEAISKYKTFLQGKTDPQALFNLAELLRSKGVDFTREIKLAEDEEKKKGLVKEAHAAFKEAVELLKDFLDKKREQMRNQGIAIDGLNDAEKEEMRNGLFNHADLHYLMAQVFEGSQDKKVEILRKAVELFEEFIWEFEDYGQAYLAYVQMGRCFVEMGEYGMALDQYANVLNVPLPEDENGRIVATPAQRLMRDRLRQMGFYRILEALVLAKKFKEALEKADEMEREFPRCIEESAPDPLSGRASILEKAKALAGLGRVSEAISEAVRVVDQGGWFMQVGMKLLGEWVAQDPSAGVRIVLLQGEGLYRTRKLIRAVEAYQNAIDKIDTPEKQKEFGTKAWSDMAMVYASREMYYEAALAYQEGERLAQTYLQGMSRSTLREEVLKTLWDQAAECSYMAYRAYKIAWEATQKNRKGGSDFIKGLYSETRQYLTTRYTDSVFAKNLQFFAGQDNLKQGQFLDAVTSFRAVDPASDFYETSLVGIGQAYFKEYDKRKSEELDKATPEQKKNFKPSKDTLDFLDQSKAAFDQYIQITETKKVEGDEAEGRRRTLFAYTYFFLSRIYNEREAWEDILKVLEGYEENYKEKADLVLTAVFIKLQAYYKLRQAREVEDMLRIMEEVDEGLRAAEKRTKRHAYLISGYQLAGALYGDLALEAKKNREKETYEEYNQKAAEYLWIWIKEDILADLASEDPAQVTNRLDAVGIKIFKAGEFEKAARIYETILSKLAANLDSDAVIRFKRKVGDCYIELEDWEKALDVFKEVYEVKKQELLLEKLVLIYTRLGDKFSQAGDAKNANINYDAALELYNVVLKSDQPEKKQWWEWKLAVWNILFKKGEYDSVVKQITNASLLYPQLGGKELAESINTLMEKAKEFAKKR